MSFVTSSDDAKLHYVDEGDGPTVVLVGGFGMAATGWLLQRNALKSRYRVVSVDRRSHGESDHVGFGQRMARHAKDIAEVMDAAGVDDAVAVGASMGASVLWSYVDLFGTDRLRGLVTVDQTPKMVNDASWDHGLYDLHPDGVEAFVTEFPGSHNPFHRTPPAEIVPLLRGGQAPPYDDLRPILREHAWADWRDVLGRVDVPLLAIAGRHSPLWPSDHAAAIADAAPQGRSLVVDDCGHVPFMEQPDEFNAALLSFLADLD